MKTLRIVEITDHYIDLRLKITIIKSLPCGCDDCERIIPDSKCLPVTTTKKISFKAIKMKTKTLNLIIYVVGDVMRA